MTPNGRFYPGTHERVVLVVGEPSSVQLACDRIVTTIYTAADTSLDITQRVLIPDAASGLIIGHDGGRLGELRQEAGVASIQVLMDVCSLLSSDKVSGTVYHNEGATGISHGRPRCFSSLAD